MVGFFYNNDSCKGSIPSQLFHPPVLPNISEEILHCCKVAGIFFNLYYYNYYYSLAFQTNNRFFFPFMRVREQLTVVSKLLAYDV